jgi:deazaflavin-dependent oxidoreductase (nitroreductase family)
VYRATGGRHTVTSVATGIPVLRLTTIGARTGLPRTTVLLAVPHDDGLVLVGSNFGSRSAPAWTRNLAAHPEAVVTHRRREARVTSQRLRGAESDRAFRAACAVYPAFRAYVERAGRDVPIYLLVGSAPWTRDESPTVGLEVRAGAVGGGDVVPVDEAAGAE